MTDREYLKTHCLDGRNCFARGCMQVCYTHLVPPLLSRWCKRGQWRACWSALAPARHQKPELDDGGISDRTSLRSISMYAVSVSVSAIASQCSFIIQCAAAIAINHGHIDNDNCMCPRAESCLLSAVLLIWRTDHITKSQLHCPLRTISPCCTADPLPLSPTQLAHKTLQTSR